MEKLQTFLNSYQLWLGIILGWVLTRIMEVLRKPTITFRPAEDSEFARGGKKFKFINIIVKNSKQNPIKKFLIGNSSLNNARVWLLFRDYASKIEVLRINGRWASTKEPVDYNSGQPIISETLILSRDTIPPGEEASVAVAIKEFSENIFFGFNNESYLHSWKHPDYELKDDKYWVQLHILADGEEYYHEFLLLNSSKGLKNFKILKK
ncbi:hypothetical protein A3B02_02430 [Candidatus Roizmanbacteria bacterium RIFCSPLOWO2_01_FULL_42_14]|uniref:Uncharacterized protein n=2 Tax=Candidatus Roizmaniibacteriota TaxID=1752723 RepID=A0A1F7JWA0_9BACT|nr:MAG: hypothetical protein A3B02_02430 [Candidatus Roizmanbacteria bacterium RIFCSPLOWO2_01_FULL_42_14]OGK59886.1 MAG: hypothetical protein A3I56_03415 [Candidatus Roizmanbacteria bacterium RIFCSPLOWO2_02_FULL_43_10]